MSTTAAAPPRSSVLSGLDRLHARARRLPGLTAFTWLTRGLLALGFLPSGLTKVLGNRFTLLGVETPVGFFFEALYQTGGWWRFIGACQLLAALLILIPRTATLGALVYFPIILNIFVIVVSMNFRGTPVVAGLMLLGSTYLLCWDWHRLRAIVASSLRPLPATSA